MFLEKLGAITGIAVIEKVEPEYHLHPSFVSGLDERFWWVEIGDDPGIFVAPRGPLRYVLLHISNLRRGMTPSMVRIESHRVAELRSIREQAEASDTHQQRLAALGMQVVHQRVYIRCGHRVSAEPHFVVDIDIHHQLRSCSGAHDAAHPYHTDEIQPTNVAAHCVFLPTFCRLTISRGALKDKKIG